MCADTNPVRIERIGTGHVRVSIRQACGDAEVARGVERIERLFDAGFDTIDVEASARMVGDRGRPTDAGRAGELVRRPTLPESPVSREAAR